MHKGRYVLHLYVLLFFVGGVNLLAQKSKAETTEGAVVTPIQEISKISVESQRLFDYYYYEAITAKSTGKHDAAFDYLQHCMSIDSTNAAVLFEFGNYYNTLDKKSKALDYYRSAADKNKDNYYYRMAFATLCLELNQLSDATEQYESLIADYPDKTDLYLYLSEAARLDGDLNKAIKALDQLELNIGLNEKISLQKFQLYAKLNDEKSGFAEIQKYIDKNPNEIKYHILLGNLYLQQNKPEEALRVYGNARKMDNENPYLISSMANYYEHINDEKSAEKELRTAIVSPKMDVNTKLGILTQYVGTLQSNKKDIKAANVLFDTLLIQHPQEPELNFMYGNLLLIQEDKDRAYDQFKIFANTNPTNPMGWEQMLATSFPDSLPRAIEVCETAIKHLPEEPQFHFFLAVSRFAKDDYDGTLSALTEGLKYVSDDNSRLKSDFYGQKGDLYYKLGKQDSAYVAYDKSLKLNPSNLGVLNNYSYYLSLERKDLDRAEKMSGLTIKADPTNPTFLDTYGWILFEQGAYTMAKIYIEKAIEHSKEKEDKISSEVLEHYGDVLFKTGDADKALEYWKKAKETGDSESATLDKKLETKTYIEKEIKEK